MKQFHKNPIKAKEPTPAIVGGIYKSLHEKTDPSPLFMLCKIDDGFTMVTLQTGRSRYVFVGHSNSATMPNPNELTIYYELVANSIPELFETFVLR